SAPQMAYALQARPAIANEPVIRWTWTRIAMLSIARGSRATTELARSARPSGPARRGEVRRMVMAANVRPDRLVDKSHFRPGSGVQFGRCNHSGSMDLTPGYREFAAPAALAPLFACLWARACDSDDEVRISPDGASDGSGSQGPVTSIVGP